MKSFLDWFKASTKVKRWIFLILLGAIAICYSIAKIIVTPEMALTSLAKIIFIFVLGFVSIVISIVFIQRRTLELIIEANDVDERSQKAKVNIKSLIFNKKVYEDGPKIVVIGGGDGLNCVLAGLKKYTNNLTAIVTMSDYSESKTVSKEVLNLLPVDDIKNSIIAMSDREDLMERLMNLDFGANSALNGLNFGDIYLAAMNEISGNISEAINKSTEVLNITGRVLPVTLDKITIAADLSDGSYATTRKDLMENLANKVVEINRVYITPSNCRPSPGVIEAIQEAEAIVVAPGSLYTSVLPILLVRNIVNTIKESKALKIFISNIMTEPGQTDGFTVSDHLKVLKEHVGVDLFNVCLVDNGEVVPEYVRKYNKDGAELVDVDQKNIPGTLVVEKKLSTIIDGKIRHNPEVVAANIIEFICNELKFNDEQNSTEYLLLQSVLKEQKKIQDKKAKDLAKGKIEEKSLKERKSKFKEKYNDRFDSIKNSDRTRIENRKKYALKQEKALREKKVKEKQVKEKQVKEKQVKEKRVKEKRKPDVISIHKKEPKRNTGRREMPKRELPKEEQNVDLLNNLSRLNRNKELMDEMSRNKNK